MRRREVKIINWIAEAREREAKKQRRRSVVRRALAAVAGVALGFIVAVIEASL